MKDLTLNVSKTIHAPIEKVFDAWLNPELLAQFILPMPGMPQPKVENEAQQGGSFTIVMQVGDDKIPHTGEYLEISRPDKLVFSWLSPCSTDGSQVTIDFKVVDSSTTDVKLTHIRFIDEETRADHEGGWTNILEMLDKALSVPVVV
ncbi:MAG: SRPBCC domain-containing protein [Proteobacteria bacterium]|nr:SRPBCC domain-containing protein [Pseudomonadota bacterium]